MNNSSCKKSKTAFVVEHLSPTRITESRNLKLGVETWGIIFSYTIESVKINCYKKGEPSTTAVLKVSDESGNVICVIKGKCVGLIFGVTEEQWSDIEKLCDYKQQLFYREFKHGLSNNFNIEQRHFYNFCHVNKKEDVFFVVYERRLNMRNKDKNDILLNIKHLQRNCSAHVINLYINHLREKK